MIRLESDDFDPNLDEFLFGCPDHLIEVSLCRGEPTTDGPGASDITHIAVVLAPCIHQDQFASPIHDRCSASISRYNYSLHGFIIGDVMQTVGSVAPSHHRWKGEPLCTVSLDGMFKHTLQICLFHSRVAGLHGCSEGQASQLAGLAKQRLF